MDYFVKYEQFAQKGRLLGKVGVVVNADSIVDALTNKAPEIVGQFAQHNALLDIEEKITVQTVVYHK